MDERKNKLEIDRECESCKGTGLYIGMAEGSGSAVVCHTCKGEGHYEETIRWTEFKRLKEKKGVKRVFASACGIGIGEGTVDGRKLKLEDFGGIEYDEWLALKNKTKFPKGTEMREIAVWILLLPLLCLNLTGCAPLIVASAAAGAIEAG